MRTPEHDIDPLFLRRWSPRAMSGAAVSPADLHRLLEAARWAPSGGNRQPWRFLYAHRDTPSWERFFGLLAEHNQVWCGRAGALLLLLSREISDQDGKPIRSHSFDAGAAWENLALQGAVLGLVVHGMGGFDLDRARAELGVPGGYTLEAMIAVGHPGKVDELPEKLRAREAPNDRRPLAEIAFEGAFPKGG